VVGDTDLIIAGYERPQDNNLALVKELLAIRAAGKGSVTDGPLADLLKRAPAGASAILAGEMKALRKGIIGGLVGPGGPFTVVPDRLLIDLTAAKATDLRWYGTFDTAKDAKAFAGSVSTLKQQGTAALKSIPENVKIKKETVALLLKTLEGVKADANDKAVSGGVQLAPELTKVLVELAELFLSDSGSPMRVPPEGGRE
jgi:hypothetical protein